VLTRCAFLIACSIFVSCASPLYLFRADSDLGIKCETIFERTEPFGVKVADCVLDSEWALPPTRVYLFRHGTYELSAHSKLDSLEATQIWAKRIGAEPEDILVEEVEGSLLDYATTFLRSRGVSEIEHMKPLEPRKPELFYDPLPPDPRPAA